MPDPEPSFDIVVILDKPCWKRSISEWEALIKPAVLKTLQKAQWTREAEINILLTDDVEIRKLNKSYLSLDKPTNVLSFPSFEPKELSDLSKGKTSHVPITLGDVVLAYETIHDESVKQNKLFDHHLAHLVVHGVLHLLGFDHEKDDDAAVMETLEIKILSSLMIPNPYLIDKN